MNTHCWGTKYSLHVFGQRLYFTHRILKCILVEGLIRARGGAYASNNFKNGAYFGNYPLLKTSAPSSVALKPVLLPLEGESSPSLSLFKEGSVCDELMIAYSEEANFEHLSTTCLYRIP